MEQHEQTQLDADKFFALLKDNKHVADDEFLNNFNDIIQKELNKAMVTKQNTLIRRLAYAKSIVTRERQLIKNGVDVFVLREDIETFIDTVKDRSVKIIESDRFPRPLPDEVIERFQQIQKLNLFDRYYIVFTDYTDEIGKQVRQEEKRKDPILFGAFEQKIDGIWDIFDRFYYIADWEDEYCDLTLAKMVDTMSKTGKDIVHNLAIPEATEQQVTSYINSLREAEQNRFTISPQKQSFFNKVRTAWKVLTK